MNKTKLLTLVIVGLLISNGILLFKLLVKHRPHGGPKAYIIEQLKFDDQQVVLYEELVQQHRHDVKAQEALMNASRHQLYAQLKLQQDEQAIDSLIAIIGQQQVAAEQINYQHFLAIKALCKGEQVQSFNTLSEEIETLFVGKERK